MNEGEEGIRKRKGEEWEQGGGMSAWGAAGPLLRGQGSGSGEKVLQAIYSSRVNWIKTCCSCPWGLEFDYTYLFFND